METKLKMEAKSSRTKEVLMQPLHSLRHKQQKTNTLEKYKILQILKLSMKFIREQMTQEKSFTMEPRIKQARRDL